MHIEKVSFYENEIFGTMAIPLKNGTNEEVVGNEDNTFIDHAEDGQNYYTFIIGDNGVGKTNLLNSIANIYHNTSRRMSYTDRQRDKQRKPYIKYVGSGLYSAENEYDELDVKIVNPNKISVTRQLLGLFYHYPKKVELLERQLGKNFDRRVEISINYRYETKDRKRFYHVGPYNDPATQGVIKALLSQGDFGPIDYSIIKGRLLSTDGYRFFENQALAPDVVLRDMSRTQIAQALRIRLESLNYNSDNNSFRGVTAVSLKKSLRSSLLSYSLYEINNTDERKELLYIMLLEELGIIRVGMKCEFTGGICDINSLSTGEKLMIKYFTIFSEITARRLKNIIFLCDEPENSLHPQWQKEFPQIMKTIIEDIYGIKNSHFIFTTHSPLIIMRSATLDNSFTIRMVRNEDGKVVVEPIEDVPQFSFENALLDVFGCSYYTEKETRTNLELIKREIERKRQKHNEELRYENRNRLDSVNRSLEVFSELNSLYKQLFPDKGL